jgi:hypothetical protein
MEMDFCISLLRRGFNELYMAFTVSNRCVEDAQAEKAGSSYLCQKSVEKVLNRVEKVLEFE